MSRVSTADVSHEAESFSGSPTSWSAYLWGFFTSKYFIIYCLLNYVWVIYAYQRTMNKFTQRTKADVERDEKYSAFKRNDIDKIKGKWLQALILSPTIMFKGVASYLPWALMFIISWIAKKLDTTKQKRIYDQWSYKVMRVLQVAVARWDFLCYCVWPGNIGIEYVKADYRKHLGPEWKDDPDKIPTTVIANHQSINDIVVSMYMGMPCQVSKASVRSWPIIGACAELFGCLFIERENKESQRSTVSQIIERQCQVEQGLYPPLRIYPEGGTSNGTQLLRFKKGAFVGLKSVQPQITQYFSQSVEIETCVGSVLDFLPFQATNLWISGTIKTLPVFEPNDYFFKHHQKEGEEKWETYARVVRSIMAENSHLTLSEYSIEDKYDYKKILFPKRKASA